MKKLSPFDDVSCGPTAAWTVRSYWSVPFESSVENVNRGPISAAVIVPSPLASNAL